MLAPHAARERAAVDTHRLGMRFEAAAARWLEARGWTVVERNVRFHRKEVDLIARRGAVIAFVEVKGRRGDGFGQPAEAVTWRKRREIEAVARWWIERHPTPGADYRFDVVAVAPGPSGRLVIEHVEDAWRAGHRGRR
jgi:putative endonuclease